MEYFYSPPAHIGPDELTIENDEFAHLTHVMRKTVGDAIRVVDGVGNAYDVRIQAISRRVARCRIEHRYIRLHEPAIDVTLAVSILKNSSRFDVLVEKTTEIGVNTIVPLLTERTIPRHAKIERWQKLALAAMKQSGRCVLPSVKKLVSFQDFLSEESRDTQRILLHEGATDLHLRQALTQPIAAKIVLCVGPEGGFTKEETDQAVRAGFRIAGLGLRRLRTETAAIIAVAEVIGTSFP